MMRAEIFASGKNKRNAIRLRQLSAAGEVFLEGEEPSKSLSADSEILCAMLLAHGAGG
ncbi:MAG: hypothetical protein U0L99_00730 [Ruminococcus sp.]|nr:hypothetical protein [Ruminococcus sp.]